MYSYCSNLDEEEREHDGERRFDLELRVVLDEVGDQAEQREEHDRAYQVHNIINDLAPQHHCHGEASHDVRDSRCVLQSVHDILDSLGYWNNLNETVVPILNQ